MAEGSLRHGPSLHVEAHVGGGVNGRDPRVRGGVHLFHITDVLQAECTRPSVLSDTSTCSSSRMPRKAASTMVSSSGAFFSARTARSFRAVPLGKIFPRSTSTLPQ
eukprot:CAMPEP_0181421088 /NCGR_PEP_ID=MMETSP1110-20121109/12922_1 /TAXON_ID=174948 /ORGANISM="Symbiodinium sp., Strain CCMP421" /LENGTH=105 /DNA_ID=CAMNT_0023544151 /DNA_START=250 /DNA_END=568 /DNA_ORIENTATION=-